ncbi:MAG: glycosyl hydrolase family 95 catalytic domain-containing protein [Muribaculaceae bacterium]
MKRIVMCGAMLLLATMSVVAKQGKVTAFLPNHTGEWTSTPKHMPTTLAPDGAICGNGDMGMVFGGEPRHQVIYFSKTDFWKALNGYPNGGPCLVGRLNIRANDLDSASYHLTQSINHATVSGTFANADRSYSMEAWCAATRNLAVVTLTAGNAPVQLSVDFESDKGRGATVTTGRKADVSWTVRQFKGDTLLWDSGVAVALRVMGAEAQNISLKPHQSATVLVQVCSSEQNADFLDDAISLVEDLTTAKLAQVRKQHTEWWNNFWSQSQVHLGDADLEKYYYGSHYLLACCSRNPLFPPGLWGTTLTTDLPAWAGDYHLNYNHQAPWWGVYSSNHIEISEPFDAPILQYMIHGASHAQKFLNCRGVYYPVGIGPKGFCTSMYPLTPQAMMRTYGIDETGLEGGFMFLGQKSDATFCTANMFMRFYHTYDAEYARKVYPFVRAVADFWEDYLTYEDGRYVSRNDNFWEVGPWEGRDYKKYFGDINPTVSLGLCRMLFKGIIDMSTYLDVDANRREQWQHILDHLSPIATTTVNGITRVKACEGGNGSGSITAPGFGRVMMHGLVFPAGVSGHFTDPEFAKILLNELNTWDGPNEFAHYEWRDARWDNMSNGLETYFTSAARLGYDGEKLLAKLKERIAKSAQTNMWITQGGGGIECFSAVPSCINEMLLQGYEGIIRLFPTWPKQRSASFTNLRTFGAFLVSASCSNGSVEGATIVSLKGQPCKLLNPWPEQGCTVVRANGKRITTNNKVIELTTSGNEVLKLMPAKSAARSNSKK